MSDEGMFESLGGRRPNRFGDYYSPEMPVISFLTNYELDVFIRLALGDSVPEIARAIHRVPKTVEARKTRLMQKLGLKKRTEITFLAIRDGLIRIDQFGRAMAVDPRPRPLAAGNRAIATIPKPPMSARAIGPSGFESAEPHGALNESSLHSHEG